jgi:hypothetical protein
MDLGAVMAYFWHGKSIGRAEIYLGSIVFF